MLDIKKKAPSQSKKVRCHSFKNAIGKKLDEYLRTAEDEVQSFQASLEENCWSHWWNDVSFWFGEGKVRCFLANTDDVFIKILQPTEMTSGVFSVLYVYTK